MEMPTDLRSVQELAELAAQEASARARDRKQLRATGQESWYITRCGRHFKEDQVEQLFERQGFELYRPKMRRMVKIRQNRLTIKQRRSGITYREPKLVPLLASYSFVRFDRRRSDWRDIFAEAHIHGMMFSEEAGETIPIFIWEWEIERMRGLEIDGAIPETTPIRKLAFELNEDVRITKSAYVGHTGTIAALPDKAVGEVDEDILFKVSIRMFGRANLVELPLSAISKL